MSCICSVDDTCRTIIRYAITVFRADDFSIHIVHVEASISRCLLCRHNIILSHLLLVFISLNGATLVV
jgi:hypothetical protein